MEHFEDILIRKGPDAALDAIKDIRDLLNTDGQVSVTNKYDGRPSIVFGYVNGVFMFNDKNRFYAKTYDGRAKNSDELVATITRKNKSPEQMKYAEDMAHLGEALSKATQGTEGLFFGDVLWMSGAGTSKPHSFTVTPNRVTYTLPNAFSYKGGVVIHSGPERLRKHTEVFFLHANGNRLRPQISREQNTLGLSPNILGLLDSAESAIIQYKDRFEMFAGGETAAKLYSHNCKTINFTDTMFVEFYMVHDIPRALSFITALACHTMSHLHDIKHNLVWELEYIFRANSMIKQTFNGEPRGEGFVVDAIHSSEDFKLVLRDFRKR